MSQAPNPIPTQPYPHALMALSCTMKARTHAHTLAHTRTHSHTLAHTPHHPAPGSHGLEILHLKYVDSPSALDPSGVGSAHLPPLRSAYSGSAHERILTGATASMPPGPFSVDIPSGPSQVS